MDKPKDPIQMSDCLWAQNVLLPEFQGNLKKLLFMAFYIRFRIPSSSIHQQHMLFEAEKRLILSMPGM